MPPPLFVWFIAPLPQLVAARSNIAIVATMPAVAARFRSFRFEVRSPSGDAKAKPKSANPEKGSNIAIPVYPEPVARVRTDDALFVPGVIVFGENEHDTPAGSPEQVSVIAPLKLPTALALTLIEAGVPAAMLAVVGVTDSEKSPAVTACAAFKAANNP